MTSRHPVYAWRVVCDTCGEGMFDLRGSSSRGKAVDKFNKDMQSIKSLAREFGVTPERFLKTING